MALVRTDRTLQDKRSEFLPHNDWDTIPLALRARWGRGMITLLEAQNYRRLRSVSVPLRSFQILVGPNGSGKSTFMDVPAFLRDLVSENLAAAVEKRIQPVGGFRDLVWGREASGFSLRIEAEIPRGQRPPSALHSFSHVRYGVSVQLEPARDSPFLANETVTLLDAIHDEVLTAVARTHTDAQFVRENGSPHPQKLQVHPKTSVLRHVPPEPKEFPATLWLATLLREGILSISLSPSELHRPSTVETEKANTLTGANLARSVFDLYERDRQSFDAWLGHVRTAVPDLETVRTEVHRETRRRYLVLRYQNGLELPSWAISDGTLCLLNLTILAYLPGRYVLYLVEEPENAVHPTAVDTIYQSLSSLYDGQLLMASHSPILLGLAKKEQLLCFSSTVEGTKIVPGDEHPVLQEWKGEVNLSDLFAAGVLG
jgi:predicted ATPase